MYKTTEPAEANITKPLTQATTDGQTVASVSSEPSHPVDPNNAFLSPGIEGAMDGSFLRGKVFIIFGSVIELNPDAKAATAAATTMLESSGAKVKGRFSKEIDFLLAGKDIDSCKI